MIALDDVLALAGEIIESVSSTTSQRELLQLLPEGGRKQAQQARWLPCVEFPSRIAECLDIDDKTATMIATACVFVYLGADILDNVADSELSGAWAARGAASATLAGATALASLTYSALSRLEDLGAAPSLISRLTFAFSCGMAKMAAGQQADVDQRAVTIDDCLRQIELKSGAEFSLFGRAVAIVGTNDTRLIEGCSAIGLAYGTAIQIASEVFDLWKGEGRDVINGTRTLALVHAQSVCSGKDAEALHEAMEQADRPGIGAVLERAGSLKFCALIIEGYLERARKLITELFDEAVGGPLAELVSSSSLLSAGR